MKTSQKILIVLSIAFCAGSAIESIRFFALKGESSYWAFIFIEGGSVAYFIAIGTHSQLYSYLNFERSIQKTAI